MKASYRQLLDEHETIERAAGDLLADLANAEVDAAKLAAHLDELARVVEDHVEVEDGVVATVDADRLAGPWTAAWVDGVAAFDRLKRSPTHWPRRSPPPLRATL